MNEQARKEVNAAVLPILGVLALAGGVALIVLGVRNRAESKRTGPVFHTQALLQGSASTLEIELPNVSIPPQTRSIAVEYTASYRGRGGYLARGQVMSGKTPWVATKSWHSRYEANTYTADHRLGIAPLSGEPVSLKLTLAPPAGGQVLQGSIRLVANPADSRESDALGNLLFGGFLSLLGLAFTAIGLVLRRQVKAARDAAGW